MTWRRFALVLVALGLLLLAWCYWSTVADPAVREAEVRLPGWADPDRHRRLGTSILPLRLMAPPDLWLIRVGPR